MIISMNKIAVISDIHGNYPALKAVLDDIDSDGIEDVICLGDIVGYYCQVNECIDMLRERKIYSLLGNHDYYMISGTCCNSRTVKMCIDYQKTIIRRDNYEWLSILKPDYDTTDISYRHGGWNDAVEERISEFDFSWVKDFSQKMYFSGHTHIQGIQENKTSGKIYCNPGSVGQPRDNKPSAAFAVIGSDGKIELRRVDYDIDEVVNKMKEAKQGEWIWKGLYTGEKVGGNKYKE